MEKKQKQIILIVILLPLMAYLIYSNVIVGMSKDKKEKKAAKKAAAVSVDASLPIAAAADSDEEGGGTLPPLNEKRAAERKRISEGSWGRDPFKPVPVKKDPKKIRGHESFQLTGVMLGGRGTAIIDGEPIVVGEVYRGYRLIEVNNTKITLEKDEQTFILTLPEDEI